MNDQNVHIIGAGVIGLCSAYYLRREGFEVTVWDQSEDSDGVSFGNAGLIVPSHFVPFASPGMVSKGLKMMFNRKSPFYIKPRLDLNLIRWLIKFNRNCNLGHVLEMAPILADLHRWSKDLYKGISDEFDFGLEEQGLLMLYRTSVQESEEFELAEQAMGLGMEARCLSVSEIQELEPGIKYDVLGGVYYPGDAHLNPGVFMTEMKNQLVKSGVKIKTGKKLNTIRTKIGGGAILEFDNGHHEHVKRIVLAMGVWTGKYLKLLGTRISLIDGKGYNVTLTNADVLPRIPAILSEAKISVTPMGGLLRISGTMELGGMSDKINPVRVQGIIEGFQKYVRGFDGYNWGSETVWGGFRPCSATGMPYIGETKDYPGIFYAAGHGMMGMSLGPATGKVDQSDGSRQTH